MRFFISDTHFDHRNIIRFCNRPFESVNEMNKTLVQNWNLTVRDEDVVYFLGDMAYGRGSRPARYWLDKLNGRVVFIRGSHDYDDEVNYHPTRIIRMNGERVLLIHNPMDVSPLWDGWVIHGHSHCNRPLVDYDHRFVNVSVEKLGYVPIPIWEVSRLMRLENSAMVWLGQREERM